MRARTLLCVSVTGDGDGLVRILSRIESSSFFFLKPISLCDSFTLQNKHKMGKTQQQRKRKRAAAANQEGSSKKQISLPSPPESSSSSDPILPADHKRLDPDEKNLELDSETIEEVDLAITIDTLSKFISNPSLLSGSSMKPLRTALHLLSSANSSLKSGSSSHGDGIIANISFCLRNSDWDRALLLLSQVEEAKIVIKLGTLQRWVRDCDSVAAITEDGNGNLGADYKVYIVIDKIMRTINGTKKPSCSRSSKDLLNDVLIRHESWSPVLTEDQRKESRDGLNQLEEVKKDGFRVCQTLEGSQRNPPNLYPAVIHTSKSGLIPLTPISQRSPVVSQDVPNVEGAKFLTNVFSREESSTFVRLAEEIGMLPDEPVSTSSAANLQSVLAHNFYWLADEELMRQLFERVKPCLPELMDGGRKLTGINSRFRLYKYTMGSVYRPHIDGMYLVQVPRSLATKDLLSSKL